MLRLTIKTGNAAFADHTHCEVARILRELADKIDDGDCAPPVKDINGNTVGKCDLK